MPAMLHSPGSNSVRDECYNAITSPCLQLPSRFNRCTAFRGSSLILPLQSKPSSTIKASDFNALVLCALWHSPSSCSCHLRALFGFKSDDLIGLAQKTQIVTAAVAKTHLSQTSMENGKGIADWLKTVKISGKLWSSARSNQISRSDVLDVVDCTNVLTSTELH